MLYNVLCSTTRENCMTPYTIWPSHMSDFVWKLSFFGFISPITDVVQTVGGKYGLIKVCDSSYHNSITQKENHNLSPAKLYV